MRLEGRRGLSFRILLTLVQTPKVIQGNEVHGNSIHVYYFSMLVALFEVNARGGRYHFDPNRGDTHSYDLILLSEKIFRDLPFRHPKIVKGLHYPLGVVLTQANPNIKVSRCARVTMVAHRVAPYDKVLNTMRVQQSQEVSEVWV